MAFKQVTDEDLITDMLAVYHELGYLTATSYTTYGNHHYRVAQLRFGSWSNACQIANIPMTRKSKRLVEMKTTRCLTCDEWFDRPKDDPTHRRCKVCKRNMLWAKDLVPEGWEVMAQ
jgi:hypothetical protein